MVWNPGDGDDVNDGGDGSDTVEVNGGGGAEDFTVEPSATAGQITFQRVSPPRPSASRRSHSERLDLNAGGGDDSMESTTADGFLLDLDGGDGNDLLDGGDAADADRRRRGRRRTCSATTTPPPPRTTCKAARATTCMVWDPGDDDDINEGGDGTDTVEVNGGGGGERLHGRAVDDRGPDRLQPHRRRTARSTSTSAPAERLDLNAGGGDDCMTLAPPAPASSSTSTAATATTRSTAATTPTCSPAGPATTASTGDNNAAGTRDTAQGGAGDDTLVWNPGDGDDTNEGGDGTDTIEVNGGGGAEVFTVAPSTTAGRISFNRISPTPPGPFNVDIGTGGAARPQRRRRRRLA